MDYGTPAGLCAEKAGYSSVFAREYSKAIVEHDGNTGDSATKMK